MKSRWRSGIFCFSSMIITTILGNVASVPTGLRRIDRLELEWFEPSKRILRKPTAGGQDVAVKLSKEGESLRDGDILWLDDDRAIVVEILPTETIVVSPKSMLEMGTVCYEIGNKHLPIFIQDDQVLIPFEPPLFRLLEATGYAPRREVRKLLNLLKANVEPHPHGSGRQRESLFSKILNLTTTS